MRSHSTDRLCRAAQQISFPAEVIGAPRIEITGCDQILMTGHAGIRMYGAGEIIVDMRSFAADIQGCGLHIVSMTRDELLIGGSLDRICLIR